MGSKHFMYQVQSVQRKFLNFAAYTLKIDHAAHYYSPVLHQFGLNTLVN